MVSGSAEDFADHERALRRRMADLEISSETLDSELADIRTARADGSADDEHDPEGSTLSSDWSRLIGLANVIGAQQDEVVRALARISIGSYGACARCGNPIGTARLAARPSADHCIDCARALSP